MRFTARGFLPSLDRAIRVAADEGAGVADLRPSASGEDPELRRLMVGRASKLERLGLAEQVAPGCWTLKPGIEDKLRDLSIRGDIIKTLHRAMGGVDRERTSQALPCTVTRRWMRYSAVQRSASTSLSRADRISRSLRGPSSRVTRSAARSRNPRLM
jgi:type IV secretory pathway VirD2 relaxase